MTAIEKRAIAVVKTGFSNIRIEVLRIARKRRAAPSGSGAPVVE
jgi:hypothetical protein